MTNRNKISLTKLVNNDPLSCDLGRVSIGRPCSRQYAGNMTKHTSNVVIILLSYLRQEAIVCGQRLSQFLVASGHKLYEYYRSHICSHKPP